MGVRITMIRCVVYLLRIFKMFHGLINNSVYVYIYIYICKIKYLLFTLTGLRELKRRVQLCFCISIVA
jgi:hypothetical protein